jgi:hypothetical protein
MLFLGVVLLELSLRISQTLECLIFHFQSFLSSDHSSRVLTEDGEVTVTGLCAADVQLSLQRLFQKNGPFEVFSARPWSSVE